MGTTVALRQRPVHRMVGPMLAVQIHIVVGFALYSSKIKRRKYENNQRVYQSLFFLGIFVSTFFICEKNPIFFILSFYRTFPGDINTFKNAIKIVGN
jgi:hypothetical protein